MNCCYTLSGKLNNAAEAERHALDKMGPSSNQPRSAVFSLAARSVMSKKDKQVMQEENKLLEKYYQDYYHHKSHDSIPKVSKNQTIDNNYKIEHEREIKNIKKQIPRQDSQSFEDDEEDVPFSNEEKIVEPAQKPAAPSRNPENMTIEQILSNVARIEKMKQDLQTAISRLPIANRHKSIIDKENEYYRMIDQLQVEWRKYTTSRVYLKYYGRID